MNYIILTELHHVSPADRDDAIAEAAEQIHGMPIDRASEDWDIFDCVEAAGLSWDTSDYGNELIIYHDELSWACHDCAYAIEYGSEYSIERRDLADDWELIHFYVEQIGYCSICECYADYAQVPGGYPVIPRD